MSDNYEQKNTTLNEMNTTTQVLETTGEIIPEAPSVISGRIRYNKDEEVKKIKQKQKQIRRKFLDMPRNYRVRRKEYH